jgi:hypothetical protein
LGALDAEAFEEDAVARPSAASNDNASSNSYSATKRIERSLDRVNDRVRDRVNEECAID